MRDILECQIVAENDDQWPVSHAAEPVYTRYKFWLKPVGM